MSDLSFTRADERTAPTYLPLEGRGNLTKPGVDRNRPTRGRARAIRVSRPGRRVILFRPSSITEKLVLGQLVSGKVNGVRERSILLDPTGVLAAVEWEIQATGENIEPGYPPVGFI